MCLYKSDEWGEKAVMVSKNKKLAIAFIIMLIFISAAVLAATVYPNAVLTFSGMDLVINESTPLDDNNENNSKTQGFVDINLKNIDTTSVSVCIKYNQKYIQLSNVEDNTPITNPPISGSVSTTNPNLRPINLEHLYFDQDKDNFPDGSFKDSTDEGAPMYFKNYPIIGIADQDLSRDFGYAILNFAPEENSDTICDNIHYVTKEKRTRLHINATDSNGLHLGRISFFVKDPVGLTNLSADERANVIDVVSFAEMDSMEKNDDGVYMAYLNDEGDISWYSQKDKHVKFEFKINSTLSDVKLQTNDLTVSAYEFFKSGEEQDLIDFLNEKMNVLILENADGSKSLDKFTWDKNKLTWVESETGLTSWDKDKHPKKGTFTVKQKYDDDFTLTATIHVTPVKLVDFTYDNEEITYWKDAENYPQNLDELNLPDKVRPVFDTYLPNGGMPELNIWHSDEADTAEIIDLPEDFKNKVVGSYKFWGHIQESDLNKPEYAWLTADTIPKIPIIRNVVENESDLPKELEVLSALTDDNGVLTIKVQNKDGSAIPDTTEFFINMPGGEEVNTLMLGTNYTVSFEADGTAIITLSPDITNSDQAKLAQLINLGQKAGNFSIASKEPDKAKGPYTDFTANTRNNYYIDNVYEFDYSDQTAGLFPVKAGESIPNTITLPSAEDKIDTTYNGYNGTEPGWLKTFTVDSWTVTEGDINTVGNVVTVEGTLLDTTYTNYGRVQNPTNTKVKIKYVVLENTGENAIDDIPDFTFDTQQEGYDYDRLQTKSFTVKNSGTTDIYGLTAVISTAKDNGKEAFVETKQLPLILKKDESTAFDISTKIGLPSDTYISTVSIYSNDKLLDTFDITFKVIPDPVFKITLKVNDEKLGSAKTDNEQYTSKAGDTITIIAEPKEDCRFTGWTVPEGSGVVIADASSATTTFEMPDKDVEITANFEETDAAKLRLTELLVKDKNDADQKPFCDKDWTTVNFDPLTREYYIAVANDTDKVKLWFKVRTGAEDAVKTITHQHDGTTDTVNNALDESDEYYKSDEFELVLSPKENLVTLTLTNNTDSSITKDYKIHIYRKVSRSDMMTFEYGNSPFGRIMRDDSITDKDAAKTAFVSAGHTFAAGTVPNGIEEGVVYRTEAWQGVNYDVNDLALFVTDKTSFFDAKYTKIINSIGGTVDETTLSRKVKVRLLSAPNTESKNGSSEDFSSIQQVTAPEGQVTDMITVDVAKTGAITELKDKRIRPDCYEFIYSFKDFNGEMVSVSKPIIILSPIGDVNISGTVDTADTARILNRFKVDLANHNNVPNYDTGGRLNKFRICDVNKDGSVNAVDANYIRVNDLIPFYTNLTGEEVADE